MAVFWSLLIICTCLWSIAAREPNRPIRHADRYQPSFLPSQTSDKISSKILTLRRATSRSPYPSSMEIMRRLQSYKHGTARARAPNTSITSVQLGSVFLASVAVGRQTLELVIDTGSSDTWLILANFTCINPNSGTKEAQNVCHFGPIYRPATTFHPVSNYNFNISYADGEFLNGIMGHENIIVAGISVSQQEIAAVEYAAWYGDGLSSGLMGLAYPYLTDAYPGNNPSLDIKGNRVPYSPILSTIYSENASAPIFSLALNRPSGANTDVAGGYLAFGGIPDVPHDPYFISTPILPSNGSIYEFYSIAVEGWAVTRDKGDQFSVTPGPSGFKRPLLARETKVIVDSGTSLIYAPDSVAAAMAAQYIPPASYSEEYGIYIVDCAAKIPVFGVSIKDKILYVNPADLLLREDETLCIAGVQPSLGGFSILGDVFLRNVLAVFDVGAAEMRFAAREFD